MQKLQQTFFVTTAAVSLLAATSAWANTATVNGITWTYTVSNGKATLGTDQFWESGRCVSSATAGAISIPSTLGGYPVTRIGQFAIHGCKSITSVIIPDGVTSIGASAFYSCTALRSVTIPNSVTSIELHAFQSCSALRSVTIPGSVTSFNGAFSSCSALTSVIIGNGVTSIGTNAFSSCSALTSVTIPNSVTSIYEGAFSGCTALRSVTIPDSVTSIGQDAFKNCPSLSANWYRTLNNLAMQGDEEPPDSRYALGTGMADRTIATVTVTGDSAIDSFVLSDGKVFDTVLRVINLSSNPSTLTLPSEYAYERLKGTEPLTIPALSTNLLTITRTADRVFFVAREELEPAQ